MCVFVCEKDLHERSLGCLLTISVSVCEGERPRGLARPAKTESQRQVWLKREEDAEGHPVKKMDRLLEILRTKGGGLEHTREENIRDA